MRYIIVNDMVHEELFWLSRYQSVHRLITHCNHRPDRYRALGVIVIKSENMKGHK